MDNDLREFAQLDTAIGVEGENLSEKRLFYKLLNNTFSSGPFSHDRRSCSRIPVPKDVIKVVVEDIHDELTEGSIVDVSLNGIRIEMDDYYDPHIKRITFNWKGERLIVQSPKVVWSDGVSIAIQFNDS